MKKALTVILIAALALTSPIFAGGAKEEGPAEVYYLNFKPEIAEVYTNEVIPAFEEATGIPLKVVTAASNQYEPTLRSEITKSEPPVIFQVNGPVGLQTWKDYAAPLEDTSFYGMLSDKSMALSADGHVLAIPYTVEGYGIIYNDAIMRAYFALPDKAVSISSTEEINSFETLKAVVEDMTKHKDELGIHARPAGILVKKLSGVKSNVTIEVKEKGKSADAKRLMAVMKMAVKQGDVVTVSIEGEDEDSVFEDIREFFETNF